ncbi:MAG: HAMP domain-containing sensor histidine kinase [Halobacteriales archaeon]|nr:HAMP domain-containing sensor histidine kinase [Halobacteriales archaeon]
MEALVDDLLQVARHGSAVTNPGEIDIEDVIETAWAGTGANSTDATVQTEPFGPIRADADRLVQLFENLFRNAVEHGGDAVTVHVGPLDAGFFVEDDGTGIADEVRDRVFDHGVTTSGEGTGYGLSIARTIANAHGWDVAVTEAATGGARFEFTGVENLRGEGGATSHEETRPE